MEKTDLMRQQVHDDARDKARALGYDGEVAVIRQYERDLRDGGVALDIDVNGLSMLATSVDWYLDLGVLSDDTRRKRLSPGRKSLIPDGRLASLQTRLRTIFYKYSHEVTILGGYRYMSNEQFEEWYPLHLDLVAQFEDVKAEYLYRYDEFVHQLTVDYRAMARETYDALRSRGDAAEREFTEQFTLSAFQDAVVHKVKSKLPSPGRMQREIRVVVRMATWMLPSEQAEDDLRREQARAEIQKLREEQDTWMRMEKALLTRNEQLAEEARAKARAAQAEADERERVLKAEADEEIVRGKAKTEAIKKAQLELARATVHETVNPFDEILAATRAEILDSVKEIRDNIRKRGFVAGKQVERINNLVMGFRTMNTANDADLETQIMALANSLDVPGTETKRDAGAITAALEDVIQTCLRVADEIADSTGVDEFALLDL